jgi:hypothetical protein
MKQTYVMQEVAIKDLKPHPSNPRRISSDAKKRLREGLEKYGLVQPIIYNLRTGFVVGGHQRLAILKETMGKDDLLSVAVVDKDEKEEAELLVFLNNVSTQGYWDDGALLNLMASGTVDNAALGFNDNEMKYFERLIKEDSDRDVSAAEKYFAESSETYEDMQVNAEENAEEIKADKETRKEKWVNITERLFEAPPPKAPEDDVPNEAFRATRENWKKQDTNTMDYLKIVFLNTDNKNNWLREMNLPTNISVIHENEMKVE